MVFEFVLEAGVCGCIFKIGVLKNLGIFTGKQYNFVKMRLQQRCFSVNTAKFSTTAFLLKTFSGCFCCLETP